MTKIKPNTQWSLANHFFGAIQRVTVATFLLAAVFFSGSVFYSNIASAQQALENDLKACAAVESVLSRLDCYDELVKTALVQDETRKTLPQISSPIVNQQPAQPPTPSVVKKSVKPTDPITPELTPELTPEITPELTPEITPELTPEITPEEPVAAPTSLASKGNQPVAEDTEVDSVGQKYLKSSRTKTEAPAFNYSLVATDKDNKQRMVFSFANGQIWKQIEPRYLWLPAELPLQVELVAGALGSYSLKLGAKGRLVKVKRVK